ncbi:MAG: NlpC/P60 family protein [Lachnospiraceae bacterium]|jgi:cell wall-associated NlpC family hydrolase
MIRSGKKWIAVSLAAVITAATAIPAFASEIDDDSAVAGVSVVINNYSASSNTPQDEIYEYLSNQETTAASTAAVINLDPDSTTAATTVQVVEDGATAQDSGLVSVLGEVNVRREPSLDAEILGTLTSNTKVTVYDTVSNEEGNWYLISADTVQGYVAASYVVTGVGDEVTVSNVTNQQAEVLTDSLALYDSASGENQIGSLTAGDTYDVVEIQGNYVKLSNGSYVVGYAPVDGVKITTEVLGTEIDDQQVAQNFTDYMTDINFGLNEYYRREAKGEYANAYYAISYVVELWGYYIDYANDLGYTDVAANAQTQLESAVAQMNEVKTKVPEDQLTPTTAYAENTTAAQTAAATAAQTAAAATTAAAAEIAAPAATETAAASTEATAAQTETAATTTAAAPSETVTETAAAPSETVTETAATETAVETTAEQTTATIAPPATVVSIEARYNGGTKYAGDVIYSSELYVHVVYSDGTEADVTEGWGCADVGMVLSEGTKVVTMTYGGLSSSFELYVNPAPTEATTTAAPETTTTAAATEATTAATTAAETTTTAAATSSIREQLVAYALSWVGQCNYVWGGTNLVQGGGVDCSGFTMVVYQRVAGISLPHYSGAQGSCGTAISYEQLRPGDLVIYSGHVAIYIGNGQIVHAKNSSVGIVTDSIFFKSGFNPIGYRSLLP